MAEQNPKDVSSSPDSTEMSQEEKEKEEALIKILKMRSFAFSTEQSESVARSYLERTNWMYEDAIKLFYGEEEPELYEIPVAKGESEMKRFQRRLRLSSKRKERGDISPSRSDSAKRQEVAEGDHNSQGTSQESQESTNRVVTLSSLNRGEEHATGQAFYAGGSVRSGQQVLGPKSSGVPVTIKEMMKSAKNHGAVVVQPKVANSGTSQPFEGPGHILGYPSSGNGAEDQPDESPDEELDLVMSAHSDTEMDYIPEDSGRASNSPSEPTCFLRVYSNGLVTNDGSFRRYDDPNTNAFITSIALGQMPVDSTEDTSLLIEDHSEEYYQHPAPTVIPFSGAGYRLGSPTPTPSMVWNEGGRKIEASGKTDDSKDTVEDEIDYSRESRFFGVCPDGPAATIQIRLADGIRVNVTTSATSTIGDLHRHLSTSFAEVCPHPFELLTGFPPRLLDNPSRTLEEEDLSKSVVIQRAIK